MCVHVHVCVIKSINWKQSIPISILHSLLHIYWMGYHELKAEYKMYSLCKIHC